MIDDTCINRMIALAKEACSKAYCPYSKFPVGAAVLSASGEIFTGCNVENASYGLTICAERNAIFHACCNGMKRLAVLVLYTPTETPTAPCGACRQVINEFGENARIFCVCDSSATIDTSLSDLLPISFGPHNLTS